MNDAIFLVIDLVNRAGALFWPFASLMFVQTLVLVVVLFLVDLALRRRLRAAVRYWLWALMLLKLLLPVTLRTPASAAYWLLREPAPAATASTMPPLETQGTPPARSTSSANSFETPEAWPPELNGKLEPAGRSARISGPCRNRRHVKYEPHRSPRPSPSRRGESSPDSQAPAGCSSPGAAAV